MAETLVGTPDPGSDVAVWLRRVLSDILEIEPSELDLTPDRLAMDVFEESLAVYETIDFAEEELGIRISDEEVDARAQDPTYTIGQFIIDLEERIEA